MELYMESVRLELSQEFEHHQKKEAAQYIESYFETYPSIKGFLDDAVEHAKENGYVTTVFGRRRPVPELSSSKFYAALVRGTCRYECSDSGDSSGYYEDCHEWCKQKTERKQYEIKTGIAGA